jgi:hypothetical protein
MTHKDAIEESEKRRYARNLSERRLAGWPHGI